MTHKPESHEEHSEQHHPSVYEPPRIEVVLSSEDLEREVLYAGLTVTN